jgi:hypothetical protein
MNMKGNNAKIKNTEVGQGCIKLCRAAVCLVETSSLTEEKRRNESDQFVCLRFVRAF